jgi:hypothetical protein
MKKLILVGIFWLSQFSEGCANLIEAIPLENRTPLERFFQSLMYGFEFGYTLFGSKPVSVAVSYPPGELSEEYAILKKGSEIWDHCQSQFSCDHFILKTCTLKNRELCITIINKSALLQVISENLEIFQLFFEKSSPEAISKQICDSNESIFDMKSPHMQSMVGILLGFGKGNALNFQRKIEVIQELNTGISHPFFAQVESLSPTAKFFLKGLSKQDHIQKRTGPTTALLNEAKEIIDQKESFEFSKTSFLVEQFLCPRFICWNDNPETTQLKQSYEHTQSILRNTYANGSFLEVTLQQWISPKG